MTELLLVLKGKMGSLERSAEPVAAAPKMRPPIEPIANVRDVLALVAYCYGMTFEVLVSERRFKDQVHARQIGIFLVRHVFPQVSLSRIGTVMHRDHTTIMHNLNVAKCRWKTEASFRVEFEMLKDEVARLGVVRPKAVAA